MFTSFIVEVSKPDSVLKVAQFVTVKSQMCVQKEPGCARHSNKLNALLIQNCAKVKQLCFTTVVIDTVIVVDDQHLTIR